MISLRCPIHKNYINERRTAICTQMWGENKNRLFYGPAGHQAIDFRTKGIFKYFFHKITKFVQLRRGETEKAGLVPIVAAHDGYLSTGFNDNYKNGIYMTIDTKDKKYRTKYFHLDKLRVWKDDKKLTAYEKKHGVNFVKAGTIIGWGGNSGKYTTGAHLHFALYKKGSAGWYPVNPMPYLKDGVVYQRYFGMTRSEFYYDGEKVPRSFLDNILN